jgi:hypothetical protein
MAKVVPRLCERTVRTTSHKAHKISHYKFLIPPTATRIYLALKMYKVNQNTVMISVNESLKFVWA